MSLINKLTLKLFNQYYYWSCSNNHSPQKINYEQFFYPLDGVLEWNKMYGPNGFQQFQCAIPAKCAIEGITEILKIIAKYRQGSFLAVIKTLWKYSISWSTLFSHSRYHTSFGFPRKTNTAKSICIFR